MINPVTIRWLIGILPELVRAAIGLWRASKEEKKEEIELRKLSRDQRSDT